MSPPERERRPAEDRTASNQLASSISKLIHSAPQPQSQASPLALMVASNWRVCQSGPMLGFYDLQLSSVLKLHGMTYHKQGERRWVGFPRQLQLDKENRPLLSPKNGKPVYSANVSISDREMRERFEKLTLRALDELFGREDAR